MFISNNETAGKERNKLCREIVVAIRGLIKKPSIDDEMKDMVAFIATSLLKISNTIDETVTAWEKRDYWIKAERFRQEWSWTESSGKKMLAALKNEDFTSIATQIPAIIQKLESVKVPEKNRIGAPWNGAFANINMNIDNI